MCKEKRKTKGRFQGDRELPSISDSPRHRRYAAMSVSVCAREHCAFCSPERIQVASTDMFVTYSIQNNSENV